MLVESEGAEDEGQVIGYVHEDDKISRFGGRVVVVVVVWRLRVISESAGLDPGRAQ